MSTSERLEHSARFWDRLHGDERFRPVFPSEAVVRFLMARFRHQLQAGEGPRALDIGVGGGRHTRLLCELGFDASGVDISAEGLDHTRTLLEQRGFLPDLKLAPMTALPFPADVFDAAVSFGVYYYGMVAEMRLAIGELFRVLKPGAAAFIVLRTIDDYRHGKGEALEPGTYRLTIRETNEEGTIQHFVSEAEVPSLFSGFAHLSFERAETTFADRTAKNSDWLITVVK
jgi:SAM-dependent methyltransferase